MAQTLSEDMLFSMGVPLVQTGVLYLSLKFERPEITRHASEKGDANEIHFVRSKWGFIVQQSLVIARAIDPIKSALLFRTKKNPILLEADGIRFPSAAYSKLPILIRLDYKHFIADDLIVVHFLCEQQFPKRRSVCFEGDATFYLGRIRKKT